MYATCQKPMELQLMDYHWPAQMEPLEQTSLAPYLSGLNSNTVNSFARLADQILSAPSPAPSDQSYGSSSSPFSSSSSSSFSSPASVASSYDTSDFSPSSLGKRGRPKRTQRATKKYGRKLKGREQSLAEQMERERERNDRLRVELNSKLTLYYEFVNLLASHLKRQDIQLASLGSGSLSRIMAEVADFAQEDTRQELERQLINFQKILVESQQEEEGPLDDNRLVYDFYTDTFTDSFAATRRQPALVS